MLATQHQQGMTLVEMLVSLVAGLLVVAGALSLFSTVIVSGNTTLMLSRLNQDVQAVTDMIVRDIQRAGYHFNAANSMSGGVPLSSAEPVKYGFSTTADLYKSSASVPPDCIRIKYWDEARAPNEAVGKVYSYDSAEKTLKVKQTDPLSNDPLSTLCYTGSKMMAEQEISVDDLRFELVSGSSATGMRSIRLSLSASHIHRPALSVSLQREIKLRNDGY